MMDSFFRWLASHNKALRTALALLLGGGLGILRIRTDMPLILLIALILWGAILFSCVAVYPLIRFQKRAMTVFTDQCDPYPFLQEMQTQVSYKLPEALHTVLRTDLAMALYNTGSLQTALNVMANIPIEGKKRVNPLHRAVYYNNLAFFRMETGDYSGSEEAYRRFLELVNAKSAKAMRKRLADTIAMGEVEHLYRIGDYATAFEKVQRIHPPKLASQVETALIRAKCAIALGNLDHARDSLNFVAQKGNKLFAVTKARELLKEL
jgi:tetratricopeptide (TPR) repeat protein